MLGLTHPALAQRSPRTEPATPRFLEQRVSEELAIEGLVLADKQLGLQIERIGDKWLVSLVELETRRIIASTRIEDVPAEREAVVAVMTHVVADLVEQLRAPAAHEATAPPPEPSRPAPIEDPASRTRELDPRELQRRSIRLGTVYDDGPGLARWAAFRGTLDQELDPEAFYVEVGRPDLADRFRSRRRRMFGGLAVAGIGYAVGGAWLAYQLGTYPSCRAADPAFARCADDKQLWFLGPVIALTASTAAAGVALYYYRRPQPISERAAKDLADEYNRRLRRTRVLSRAHPRRGRGIDELRLIPYTDGGQAGLVLAGAF